MKNALVVGGANGIGLAVARQLALRQDVETVNIVDRVAVAPEYIHPKFRFHIFDLMSDDFSFFDRFYETDTLMITAGFGKLSLFEDMDDDYIRSSFIVNAIAPIRIIKKFYPQLKSNKDFYCGVMVSIAGFMSSPFFSVYAATKASLKIFIESVNVEVSKAGYVNRILNVSPGSIKGTAFSNGRNDLSLTEPLANDIVMNLEAHNDLLIPQYDEIFKSVLQRYHDDFRAEGSRSYDYKLNTGRIK